MTNNQFHIPTAEPLRTYVHSVWQMDRQGERHTETIIPKGVVEIIFNFSPAPPIEVQIGNQQFLLEKCFINGFNTQPIHLISPEKQHFFGVRFHPTAIRQLFRAPAGEFANQATDLTLVDNSINTLWHQLAEADSLENRIVILSGWIAQRIKPVFERDYLLNQFLNETSSTIPTVSELAGNLYYSTRQLSRKLKELTGINTEQILAYKKFLLAVQLMHHTDLSLTRIAYNSQFSDQSHFIRNFKSFASITPFDYLKSKSRMPGHLYKDVR